MKYYFSTESQGLPCSLYVTRKGEIMPELCERDEGNEISPETVRELRTAKGWNSCFNDNSKREYARHCSYNNTVVQKHEINDDSNNEIVAEYSVAELRKMGATRLEEFLREED